MILRTKGKDKLTYAIKRNEYLDHYIKHNISPVRQDISKIDAHILRRKTLYRMLGLLPSSFAGKDILEVGPGSGYNALVVAKWKPAKLVLIEPNPTGAKHISELFKKNGITGNRVKVCNKMIEQFTSGERFDIVLCEGLIPGLRNKNEVLSRLDSLLKEDGVLVVTCADEISTFFELIRYFFAFRLTGRINNFKDKLKVLIEAFGSHLDSLGGFSRLKEDWCADALLGEAHFNYDFSLKKCIQFFKERYFIYNASPDLFTDYRWYKQIPREPALFNKPYLEEFDRKKHNLFYCRAALSQRPAKKNEELLSLCRQAMSIIHEAVKSDTCQAEKKLLHVCELLGRNLSGTDSNLLKALADIREILIKKDYKVSSISRKYKFFISAFGRGQQYISFIKACPLR